MHASLLILFAGIVLLFLGQRLYWLFVAAVGFVVGMDLATRWLTDQAAGTVLLIALLAGVIGAMLAVFFQRLAIGLAAFFAGGHFALLALADLGSPVSSGATMVVYFVAGLLAGILAVVLLDWALVILSALVGAALIAQWATPDPTWRALLFLGLFLLGAAVQASLLRRRRSAPA